MNIIRIYKRRIIFIVMYVLISFIALWFVRNDEHLYRDTVVKVQSVSHEQYSAGESAGSDTYLQVLYGKILNGAHEGETVTLTNIYSESLTVDERYVKGDKLKIGRASCRERV